MTSLTSVVCSLPPHADPQRAVKDTESAEKTREDCADWLLPNRDLSLERRTTRIPQTRVCGKIGRWRDHEKKTSPSTGDFLGEVDFVWCPEGLREADAHLLFGRSPGGGSSRLAAGGGRCVPLAGDEGCEPGRARPVRGVMLRDAADIGPTGPGYGCRSCRPTPYQPCRGRLVRDRLHGVRARCRSWPTRLRRDARVLAWCCGPAGAGCRCRFIFMSRLVFPDDPGPAGLTAHEGPLPLRGG